MNPDRERGFIVIQRQIQSSALWLSLRGDQRSVLVTILLLANWTPGRARWKGRWYDVGRGELSHSLPTISREAATSVAVVRSTLVALLADDEHIGGNGPFLTQRYPISNTGPSTGPRVLTVVNYNKYQDKPDAANTGTNADSTRNLAQPSHSPHTDLAWIEQDQQLNKETPTPRQVGAALRQAIDAKAPLDGIFPATAAVIGILRDQGIYITHAKGDEQRQGIERAIAEVTTTVAAQRVGASYGQNKRASMGWHLEAITGGPKAKARDPRRGMAPPSTDFTSKEATEL
jgi:hypothetical protein